MIGLFLVDIISAFIAIVPEVLHFKLTQLMVPTVQWITHFLTKRREQVKLQKITFSSWILSTVAPCRDVSSPLCSSSSTQMIASKETCLLI